MHISAGETVAECLPVRFKHLHGGYGTLPNENRSSRKRKILRVEILGVFHDSISFFLCPTIDVAVSGFFIGNKSSLRHRVHRIITFYVADKTDAEDMLILKMGNTNVSTFHSCIIEK